MKKLITFALFIAVTAAPAAFAHEGHAHKVMGTVAAISGEQIEVTNTEGKKETHPLTKQTMFMKGKLMAAAKDVTVGTRVVLSVVEKDGKKSVSMVMIGGADAAPAAPAATPHKH